MEGRRWRKEGGRGRGRYSLEDGAKTLTKVIGAINGSKVVPRHSTVLLNELRVIHEARGEVDERGDHLTTTHSYHL